MLVLPGSVPGRSRYRICGEGRLKANLAGNHKRVLGVVLTPDGKTLASAWRGTIRLWQLPTSRLMFT